MNSTDYIMRHNMRIFSDVNCKVLRKNTKTGTWDSYGEEKVVIPVDSFIGKQDPYVFYRSWLYGYCHNYSIKKDTTPKSVFVWGAWSKENTAFLSDLIFVQEKRYNWLSEDEGFEPSETFKSFHPYRENDNIFTDFICHRTLHGEYPKSKFILEAKKFDPGNFNIPTKKTESFFSFIPLFEENGIYYMIDLLPCIITYDSDFQKSFTSARNKSGVRSIDYITSVIKYIYEKSNCLVVDILQNGSPKEIDVKLQEKYYPLIYGCSFDIDRIIENSKFRSEDQD